MPLIESNLDRADGPEAGSPRPAIADSLRSIRPSSSCFSAGGQEHSFRHCGISLCSSGSVSCSWTSRRQQPFLHVRKYRHDMARAGPKVQHQTTCTADKLRRPVHPLLQHRLEPSASPKGTSCGASGRMLHRREFPGQPQLPDQPQAVVGEPADVQQLVSNFPDGKRSRSRSVWISEWNCSCVP